MKRSSMIKQIAIYIQDTEDLHPSVRAEEILDLIELLGMEPPTYFAEKPGYHGSFVEMCRGWEAESEGAWGSIADATGTSTDDQ